MEQTTLETRNRMKPILFSTQMVQAILAGRKTMTRRMIKDNIPLGNWEETLLKCPYGKAGDTLWVRETFVRGCTDDGEGNVSPEQYWYRADNDHLEWHNEKKGEPGNVPWKPSIFMPYHACRLFLRITDIRVERLQDISEEDAKAEGVIDKEDNYPLDNPDWKVCPNCGGDGTFELQSLQGAYPGVDCKECETFYKRFKHLWTSINGAESWTTNPWVWVVSFEQIEKPE